MCSQTMVLVAAATDMQVRIKLSVAASTDKLDLSSFGLSELPAGVCNLPDLQVNVITVALLHNAAVVLLFNIFLSRTWPVH